MKTEFKAVLFSFFILLFAGVVAGGIIWYLMGSERTDAEAESVEAMNEFAYDSPEITTDLKDRRFVRIQFSVITNGKKAQTEMEDRESQVKNILIKEISVMEVDDFSTELSELEAMVMDHLNEVLNNGEMTEVYTTSKILQ